jgi:flagellar capping protein FliD
MPQSKPQRIAELNGMITLNTNRLNIEKNIYDSKVEYYNQSLQQVKDKYEERVHFLQEKIKKSTLELEKLTTETSS